MCNGFQGRKHSTLVLGVLSKGLEGDYPNSVRYPNSHKVRYLVIVKVDGDSYDKNWLWRDLFWLS